jgi:hypothetical protein
MLGVSEHSVGIIELLNDIETIINTNLRVIHNAKSRWDYFADVCVCSLSAVPLEFEAIRKAILEAKARDTRSRFITEITKESISYTKEFMKIVELRHLDGVKGNFGVCDSEYIAISTTGTSQDEPKSVPHAVYSNKRGDVQQHQFIFGILWTKAIPAEQRNRKIEESVQPVSTRVLEDVSNYQQNKMPKL